MIPASCSPSTHKRGCFSIHRCPSVWLQHLECSRESWRVFCWAFYRSQFYLDILITGQTEAEHLRRLNEVLARLEESGLHLNQTKCIFMAKSVSYLGHRIDAEGLHPLPDKVAAVLEAPLP